MKTIELKKKSPVPYSKRGVKIIQKNLLWQGKVLKSSAVGLSNKAGRNNFGRITAFHRGGGHKKTYRNLDFQRLQTCGIVSSLEYDSNRTAFIARIYNKTTKTSTYILAPKNIFVGAFVKSGQDADIQVGHAMPLEKIPVGSLIHNISLKPFGKGQLTRSAGTYAQLLQKTKLFGRVRVSSGEQRLISLKATATLGVVSNENQKLLQKGKAGRNRWLNRRPHVRGVAMNPIDHPHGGGEGKTSGGRPSVTPWGKPTKGPKTSRSKNPFVLISRRGKNKIL